MPASVAAPSYSTLQTMHLDRPLRFRPLVKRALWGGRKLGDRLGKSLGAETDYAESWEIVDHGADQSVVIDGPAAGKTLSQLLQSHAAELLGRHAPQSRFPLLFKFLDCREKLSVQVHPNDAQGAKLSPPDLGKTEAWVVLGVEPGSVIYAGLKRGFDRAAFERELRNGTGDLCLHRFEPRVGDCLFLPAGVVHAPGGGILMAEIQQSSDVTFRLHDWNRIGADGKPRALHIEQALDVINYDYGPANPQRPQPTADRRVEQLVACDKFVLERIQLEAEPYSLPSDDRFRILAACDGNAELDGRPFAVGETALIPANCRGARLVGRSGATVLSAYLP
jgi:mannose-6-phosphate isomerase